MKSSYSSSTVTDDQKFNSANAPPLSSNSSSTVTDGPIYDSANPPPPSSEQTPPGTEVPWSTGLFSCFDDVPICLVTWCCPTITFARIAAIVDKKEISSCFSYCYPLFSRGYRFKLRQQYSLEEAPCNDDMIFSWCEICALCQEYRELKNRGFDMSIDIGNKWGHFLQVDENTLKERSFEKGSILIATDQIEKIDGYIELVIQQVKYTVRIEEEETFRFIKKSIFPVTTELPMDEKDEHIEDDVMAMYKGEMEKHDDLETKQGDEESNNNTEVGSSLGIKTSVMGSGYIPDSFEGILNPVEPNYAANSSNILETQDADGSREKVSNEENELEVDNSMEDLVLNHKEINEEGTNTDPIEDNHNPIQAAVKSIKGKKKRKNIDQILGFSKVNTWNQKRGRNKNKCVVLRSAVAAAALSASVSSEGINNRNRILLDRAQTIWAINKMMGIGYDGDEDEVISKIAEMEAQNEDKAEYQL